MPHFHAELGICYEVRYCLKHCVRNVYNHFFILVALYSSDSRHAQNFKKMQLYCIMASPYVFVPQ